MRGNVVLDAPGPENDLVDVEVRQLQFGRRANAHRALATIAGKDVRILHVRRALRDTATPEDLHG